jgi:hypothetical protein
MKETHICYQLNREIYSLSLFPSVCPNGVGKRRVPAAHRAIGHLPRARKLGEEGGQFVIGWKVNATVHNTASPETLQDWQCCFVS